MKLLADLNIAPRTVLALRDQGFDIVRASDVLPLRARDVEIVDYARTNGFAIITHDLDFSALVALSGAARPSVISIRLGSAHADAVTRRLTAVLPAVRADVLAA